MYRQISLLQILPGFMRFATIRIMGEDVTHLDVAMTTFLSELSRLELGGYDDTYDHAENDGTGTQTWGAVKAIKKSLKLIGGIDNIQDRAVRERYRLMMRRFGAEDGL